MKGYLNDTNINPSSEVSFATWIAFLSNIVVIHAWKYQNLCPRVVQSVNNNNIVIF